LKATRKCGLITNAKFKARVKKLLQKLFPHVG
jgi:hypothetical protein